MDVEHALKARVAGVTDANDRGRAPNEAGEARLRTRPEAAEFLRVSLNTIDRLRYQRNLAYYQIGGSVRFGDWDLMEFVTGKVVLPEHVIRDQDRILNKCDLARFLAVATRTVEHLLRNGCLWHRTTGRVVRFRLGDVLIQLMNDFRVPAQASPAGGKLVASHFRPT